MPNLLLPINSFMFPRGHLEDERCHIAYSLAHDSRSNVYKLLGIFFGKNIRLRFYSTETKTWRCVEDSHPPCGIVEFDDEPTIVNGAFHWLCCHYNGNNVTPHVVSLDICDETYGMFAMPKQFYPFSSNLCVVKGKLCVMCDTSSLDSERCWEIWVMNEYGVADSMARMFSLSHDELARFSCPLYTLENVEIIMIYAIHIRGLHELVGRQIMKKTVPYAFVESLVSPHTCLGNNNVVSRTEIVANYKFSAMLKKVFGRTKQVWTKPKQFLKRLVFAKVSNFGL